MERCGESLHKKKCILTLTIISCILVLSIFKYLFYITKSLGTVLGLVHINVVFPIFSIAIPVGISFYLFQSMGYVIDVYRGTIHAEKNFILYAAYISFFPQLVAGPIERADKLLPQFLEEHKFDYQRVKNSLILMLWGFFMKIVIADRIAIFVDRVYDNYETYGGCLLIIATVLFAFQIYCDFAGYTLIAKGAAGVMGFILMDNFASPYCAKSVREFWSRWHISLTSWFRDYVYIPLGGNRKGTVRKYLNTLIVFLLSGLWHGPSWSFVFWGALNGAFIILEELLEKIRKKLSKHIRINIPKMISRILGMLTTFVLVDISWIFFRASSLKLAAKIIRSMLTFSNANAISDNTINYQILDNSNFALIFVVLLILIVVDVCHYNGVEIRQILEKQNVLIRWFFYWLLVTSIIILGIWGPSFSEAAFIYFQF